MTTKVSQDIAPFSASMYGIALLWCAAPSARLLNQFAPFLFYVYLCLWFALTAWGASRAAVHTNDAKALWRYPVTLCLFTGTLFLPAPIRDFPMLNAQILSLAGIALLFFGLANWPRTYPVLFQINKILQHALKIPPRVFITLLAFSFTVLCVFISWRFYAFLPTIVDTIAQYVHAKVVAQGQLYGQVHPLQRFFHVSLMFNDNHFFSQYQPLHVFLLALGHVFHAPWLVNPLVGALTIILIYLLMRGIAGEAAGRIAVLLAFACPMVVFMSSEYMNHATALCFTTLMLYAYYRTLEAQEQGYDLEAMRWGFVTGLALGGVFLTRPLTAVGVGLPIVAHAGWLLLRQPRIYFYPLLTFATAGILCLLFQGWYNFQTMGDLFLFPYAGHHASNVPGFNNGHTPWTALLKGELEWARANILLFEWYVPNLLFVALACLLPLRNRYLRLMVWIIVSATVVNGINRFSSYIFGPRYIYEAMSCVIMLSALGITRLPLLLRYAHIRLPSPPVTNGILATTLLAAYAAGWTYQLPYYVHTYSSHYFNGNTDFYFNLLNVAQKPALIFVGREPQPPAKKSSYNWVAHTNPQPDDAPVIFARDRGDKNNRQLIDYYPNRHVYIERGGQLTPVP